MGFPRTKIQPPRPRPGALVERPALARRLGEALRTRRLVLVCAAAGFGKTSALAQQIEALPQDHAVVWVACDEGDSPTRLFECLVAALEPHDPPWRTAPEALVRAAAEADTPQRRRAIAAELINALDACEAAHGVIVADDLHRIGEPAVFEFIDQLLERMSPRWTLALATRTEPPLALARLRAREEIAEFRAEDLRFERDDARALAASRGWDAAQADALLARTMGWPAGLRLAMNALDARRSAHAGADGIVSPAIDRHAFDFLAAEVIDQLAPAMRRFLLVTSVLPELTASRCAALSGDLMAAQRLEEIERDGLFVSALAGSEPTLRLHDLFRDALQARLARDLPDELPNLLRRAADTETDLSRRVHWLLRAGEPDAAARALADSAHALVTHGQSALLRQLLEGFSAAQIAQSPGLQTARALLAWTRWDWATVIETTSRAAAVLRERGNAAGERVALSYHCIALAGANQREARATIDALMTDPALDGEPLGRALVASAWVDLRGGDQRRLAPQWRRLVDLLERSDSLPHWYECSPLPPMVGMPGMRAGLQRYIDGALRRLPEHATPLRGMCTVVQAWLHLWVGEIEQAEACAAAADADARWLAQPVAVSSYLRALQAVLLALRGRRAESLATVQGLVDEVRASVEPMRARVYLGLYHFMALRCAAILDERDTVAQAAGELVRGVDGPDDVGWLSAAQRSGAFAHQAEAAGDLDEACARWRAVLAQEHSADLYGQLAEARLRLADMLLRRGRPPAEAVTVLGPLFDSLAHSGEWGATLMAGPRVLARLAGADWDGRLPQDRAAELARWSTAATALATPADAASAVATAAATAAAGAAAPGALSPRELEVLALIAAGESNKVIARCFELSPHTVKRHVANILDKLALSSRGQAAAWYRDHG